MSDSAPRRGRLAQAALNDQRILDAAKAVFVANPAAPITEVAHHAGVGIGALYTRFASKQDLLRRICADGLALIVAETEAALVDSHDHWTAFSDYMRRCVDADTTSMTLALAGTFTPTAEMLALAERANQLALALFDRYAHLLRPGIETHDLSLVFELCAAIKTLDPQRTRELRRRYLVIILDGLRARDGVALPAPGPTWQELNERWRVDRRRPRLRRMTSERFTPDTRQAGDPAD